MQLLLTYNQAQAYTNGKYNTLSVRQGYYAILTPYIKTNWHSGLGDYEGSESYTAIGGNFNMNFIRQLCDEVKELIKEKLQIPGVLNLPWLHLTIIWRWMYEGTISISFIPYPSDTNWEEGFSTQIQTKVAAVRKRDGWFVIGKIIYKTFQHNPLTGKPLQWSSKWFTLEW